MVSLSRKGRSEAKPLDAFIACRPHLGSILATISPCCRLPNPLLRRSGIVSPPLLALKRAMSLAAFPAALLLRRAADQHRRITASPMLLANTGQPDTCASHFPATRRASSSNAQRYHKRDGAHDVHVPKSRQPHSASDSSRYPRRSANRSRNPRDATDEAGGSTHSNRPPVPVYEAILSLRAHLAGLDVDSVWSSWKQLEALGGTKWLGNRDRGEILKLCSQRICPPTSASFSVPKREAWDDRCSHWASHEARSGNAKLAGAWAKLAIVAGRLDIVELLLQESLEASKAKAVDPNEAESPALATPAETTDVLEGGSSDEVSSHASASEATAEAQETPSAKLARLGRNSQQQADYHDLLACLIVSHAMRDELEGLVTTVARFEIGTVFNMYFKPNKVADMADGIFRTLQSLQSYPSASSPPSSSWPNSEASLADLKALQAKVDQFTTHAELARGSLTGPGSSRRIARLLGSLFSSRRPNEAWSLFVAALKASSGPRPWLQFRTGEDETTAGQAIWNESCWSVCLSGFIAAGKPDLALKIWAKYHELGFQPSPKIWNALLDGYSRAKNYDAARRTWEQLRSPPNEGGLTVAPDATMYTTMISVHFRDRQPGAALALFLEMQERHEADPAAFQIPSETCNAVIHGLCVNGHLEDAQSVLAQMQKKGPQPTINTYNALLRAHGRRGDLASLAATLRAIEQQQLLQPDVVTFTTVLDALLRKGGDPAGESVLQVLQVMESMGVKANAVTYTALIKACLVGSEAISVDLATEGVLSSSRFRSRSGGEPARSTASSATAVAAVAPGDGSGDFADPRIDAALNLLDRMIKMRIEPTEVTYTALIGAVLRHPVLVAQAFANHQLPARYVAVPRPLRALNETDATVRGWRDTCPDISLALLLLDKMRERGLTPNSTTYHYLICGLARYDTNRAAFLRALALMDEMVSASSTGRLARTEATKMGPFVASVLGAIGGGNTEVKTRLDKAGSLGYSSWVVMLTTLSDRLEHGARDAEHRRECVAALRTAIRLMHDCDADRLKGSDGGTALLRIFTRAHELLSQLRV
ncbi:hypothetical protein ACQY0O_003568 [Thecaphora frezii]